MHFPECASWTPALQVACKREGGGQNFMVQRVKQGLHDGKDRKMHLLQFTEVPVGDTVIPTHWPSLQEIFSQTLFKVLPHLSQATHAAASFDLIEALFQRHLVFIRFTKALLYNTLFSFVGDSLNVSMFVNTLVIFSYRVKGNPQVIFSSSQLDDIVTFVLAPIIEKSITFVLSVIS